MKNEEKKHTQAALLHEKPFVHRWFDILPSDWDILYYRYYSKKRERTEKKKKTGRVNENIFVEASYFTRHEMWVSLCKYLILWLLLLFSRLLADGYIKCKWFQPVDFVRIATCGVRVLKKPSRFGKKRIRRKKVTIHHKKLSNQYGWKTDFIALLTHFSFWLT